MFFHFLPPTWSGFWSIRFQLLLIFFIKFNILCPPGGATVLDLLQAHRTLPFALLGKPDGLQSCTKPQPQLRLTFSLSLTQAALTRASRSDSRLPSGVSLSDNCLHLRMGCICCFFSSFLSFKVLCFRFYITSYRAFPPPMHSDIPTN